MFKKRLEELRNEKGLTKQEMADMIGITRQAYGNYENGKREPDFNTTQKLADYFNVSVDYLLGRSDIRETPEQRIEAAISDDQELLEFWQELVKRDDLQLLFKQVKPLPPRSIKKIIKIIKAIEDEEAMEDL